MYFLKMYFHYLKMMCICVLYIAHIEYRYPQRVRVLDSPRVELQVIGSHPFRVLEAKLRSILRASSRHSTTTWPYLFLVLLLCVWNIAKAPSLTTI